MGIKTESCHETEANDFTKNSMTHFLVFLFYYRCNSIQQEANVKAITTSDFKNEFMLKANRNTQVKNWS